MKKNRTLLVLLLLCAMLLTACGEKEPAVMVDSAGFLFSEKDGTAILENGERILDTSGRGFDAPDDNYRVFYEIFTGSFSDSDGDGVGDLRGIIDTRDHEPYELRCGYLIGIGVDLLLDVVQKRTAAQQHHKDDDHDRRKS